MDHLQLVSKSFLDFMLPRTDTGFLQDIYGELMDCIYLAQKYSKPLVSCDAACRGARTRSLSCDRDQSWDSWVAIRQVIDYVCTQVNEPDLSIWYVL